MRKQDLKPSPSSPADSRASPSPPQESGGALRMNATCGRRCAALLPNCGPVGCLGKMLLASSIWGSTKRFLTWQKRDTLFSHSYFRLAASAHGMSASELLSSRLMFPTPLASDKSTGRDAANLDVFLSDNGIFRKRNKDGTIWSLSLSAAVFYLTPAASEGYCYVDGLYDLLGEYANLDELNYLASKLDDMSQDEYERFQAAMEIGDHTGSIQELINLTENLDCYDVYPDIHDHDDLGRYYIEELDAMQVPEHLRNYIDYEAYGRDIALEESGQFTDLGYVRDTGDSFHEYYDGERGSIPEEYRVMTFQDDIPEEEISEWAMDLAYDMDEFFRQHDPQYAAEHPEEHAAKEEIYENLSDCRIASLEEKLKALGQTPEDYLPSELEKFKEAVGYEAYLDVDPQAIREAIENPDQSHVDEMLSFAEQANREYEAELYGQQAAPTPDDRETGETVRTPRGTFHVTDMSREQMEAAGYGFHHESEDGKYLIMTNGSRAFAIPNGDTPEHTAPEKLTVLVVEPMKEPYVKEIDPGLHALQAEVGGDIAASYPFDDPVGLVLNDEGKLIGLDLNRSLRDEHGEIYDIVAGTFLVVGLGPESFASLPPDMIQKYTEQFKRPELFASINGQIVSVPVEPENPLRTAEMTLEDDYGMIDGIINNGRRGEELEKAQAEARRTTPEKKPSIRERLEDAKRECAERKSPDKPAPQKKPPELGDL